MARGAPSWGVRASVVAASVALVALGCSKEQPIESATGVSATSTATSTTSSTSSSSSSTSSASSAATQVGESSGTTCPAEPPPFGEPCSPECPFEGGVCECGKWGPEHEPYPGCNFENPCCPEGEKCAPVFHKDVYNVLEECVPIVARPKGEFEACTVAEGFEYYGPDDCEEGLVCLYGRCMRLCSWYPDSPSPYQCVGEDACAGIWSANWKGRVCRQPCDPFATSCPEGLACVLDFGVFTCFPHGEAQLGEACSTTPPYLCGQELGCTAPCPGGGNETCCSPICDLNLAQPCEDPTLVCLPAYFDPWPGQEHLGICSVPP